MKPVSEMTTDEILEEITMLRDRRAARRDAAMTKRSNAGNGNLKPRKKKEVEVAEAGLDDILGNILEGDDDGTALLGGS